MLPRTTRRGTSRETGFKGIRSSEFTGILPHRELTGSGHVLLKEKQHVGSWEGWASPFKTPLSFHVGNYCVLMIKEKNWGGFCTFRKSCSVRGKSNIYTVTFNYVVFFFFLHIKCACHMLMYFILVLIQVVF